MGGWEKRRIKEGRDGERGGKDERVGSDRRNIHIICIHMACMRESRKREQGSSEREREFGAEDEPTTRGRARREASAGERHVRGGGGSPRVR